VLRFPLMFMLGAVVAAVVGIVLVCVTVSVIACVGAVVGSWAFPWVGEVGMVANGVWPPKLSGVVPEVEVAPPLEQAASNIDERTRRIAPFASQLFFLVCNISLSLLKVIN
jgi:hypothetical protein